MSWFQVCGFIATIMSTPPRRARWPCSLILTSNQVGRPWMFDGKMLREMAGTPMRRIALAKSPLALAEPEPLTLANLTTKSLTAVIAGTAVIVSDGIASVLFKRACAHRRPVAGPPPCPPPLAGEGFCRYPLPRKRGRVGEGVCRREAGGRIAERGHRWARHAGPACVMSIRNFFMSQAPVG